MDRQTGGCTWSGTPPLWIDRQGGVPGQVLPPPRGQTDACKLITLSQTSFAGGNDFRSWSLLLVKDQWLI